MVVSTYLKQLLTHFTPYLVSDDERKIVARDPQLFILQKLLRKKFRKKQLHPKRIADITEKVSVSLKEKYPLYITIPFGGYKHFWNPSYPEIDWAELFTLKFLTEWLSPVLALHQPGAIIEFISEDVILTRMDNYPEEALDQYVKSFTFLVGVYKKYLPKNLDIRFFRICDKFDKREIVAEVEKMLPGSWKKWATYSPEQKDLELKRSKRSMMWKGQLDLTKLSDEAKQRRIIESRLIELAYYEVEIRSEFLSDYFTRENRFSIFFSFGLSADDIDHTLTLGSTYASTVDFWIGRGIVGENDDVFVNRIVSKEQYSKIKDSLRTTEIKLEELPLKNFKTIETINERDWQKIFDKIRGSTLL